MAASGSGRGWWVAVPVLLFLLITWFFWPALDNEEPPTARKATESAAPKPVEILSWDWNKSVKGDFFAVHGKLRNHSNRRVRRVTLELRLEDAEERPIERYSLVIENLSPGQEKIFREDVPRTGREVRGFLEVREVTH